MGRLLRSISAGGRPFSAAWFGASVAYEKDAGHLLVACAFTAMATSVCWTGLRRDGPRHHRRWSDLPGRLPSAPTALSPCSRQGLPRAWHRARSLPITGTESRPSPVQPAYAACYAAGTGVGFGSTSLGLLANGSDRRLHLGPLHFADCRGPHALPTSRAGATSCSGAQRVTNTARHHHLCSVLADERRWSSL